MLQNRKRQLEHLVPKKDFTPTHSQSPQSMHPPTSQDFDMKEAPIAFGYHLGGAFKVFGFQTEILSNPCAVRPPHVQAEPCRIPLKSKSGSETKASVASCSLGQSPSRGCAPRPLPDSQRCLNAVPCYCLRKQSFLFLELQAGSRNRK